MFSNSFISVLIVTITSFLLLSCIIYFSLSGFLRWKVGSLVWNLCSFVFNTIDFPLDTAKAVNRDFKFPFWVFVWFICYLHLLYNFKLFRDIQYISVTDFLFNSVVKVDGYLITTLKFLKIVAWHRIKSVLVNAPWEFEMNVHFAVVGWSSL